MIKQLFLPLAAVAVFIVLVGLYSRNPSSLNLSSFFSTPTPSVSGAQTKPLTIGNKTIQVEIANSPGLRSKGLSGRNTMADDYGMLFIFDSKKVSPSFWMKDTLIPLDIIWIRDNRVEKIDKDVPTPAPDTPDNKLPKYTSGRPVDYVLEVNAGFNQKNGIKVGDPLTLPTL